MKQQAPVFYLWMHNNLKNHIDNNNMVDIGKVREVFSTYHIRKEMINEVIKEMVKFGLISKANKGKNSDKVVVNNISSEYLKSLIE